MGEACSDCERRRWPGTRTAKVTDCLAAESERGALECARITIIRLRSELAAVRKELESERAVVGGDDIRALRLALKLRQQDVARAIDRTIAYISDMELGRRAVSKELRAWYLDRTREPAPIEKAGA